MKKISKLLKSLALSIVSLCMVFGIVFNVKGEDARRVNADTSSKVYSTDYYTLSYADNEVKLLLSTSLLEYQDLLSKEDLAELKNAIVSVGYSAIFDDLDFSTTSKTSKARKKLAAQSANGQEIDISLITELILDQLAKGSEYETEQAISNALSSEGTYDTVLEFYVDRYVEKYADGNEEKAAEAYSEITEDLCDAFQTAVNNADLGAHFTADIIQDKVQSIVDNAALEGQVELSLGQVTDVVNLLEDKTVVADVIKQLEIQSYVVDVVKQASPEETTNFLIQVETQTIIEVFNTVEISKEEVKEVITNVGVDKLIEVLDKKGMDDVKELAGAVGLTKQDIQDTVYDNLSNISINTLLASFRSIKVNGHALYEGGEIKEEGFVALLKTIPSLSEIASYTDDQMNLTWNLYVDTVFGQVEFDLTVGFKGDCSTIRKLARTAAEYLAIDVTDGVVNVEVTSPAKLSDAILRASESGLLSDSKKVTIFNNLFATVGEVYNNITDKTYEEYINILKEVDYKTIVANVYNAENLNRVFRTDAFTDARLDKFVDEVCELVSYSSTITYDRVKAFVSKYVDISRLDNTAVETLINKAHEVLVRIDKKSLNSALLREFIDPNSEYTSDNIDRYIDKLYNYEGYFNTVMSYVDRVYNAAPDRFKDNSILDFYQGDGTFNYAGTFNLDYDRVLDKLTPKIPTSYADEISSVLYTIADKLPSQISVNFTLNLTDIHRVTYYVGDEVRDGMLPEGANLELFANSTEVNGYQIHGWRDANNNVYTTMPNFDVELYPITHDFNVSINEGISKVYDGQTYELVVSTDPVNNYLYQWYKDGVALVNANSATYTVVDVADTGSYYCEVTSYEVMKTTETVNVTITPYQIDASLFTWDGDLSYVYDKAEHGLTLVIPEEYEGLVTVTPAGHKATTVGQYTATATVVANDTNNYEVVNAVNSQDWEITKYLINASLFTWVGSLEVQYNGQEQGLELVTPEEYEGLVTVTPAGHKATNAGEYTATATVVANDTVNYVVVNDIASQDWEITKIQIDASLFTWTGDLVVKYNGQEQGLELVTPAEYKGLVTATPAGHKATNAGEYTATATVVANDTTNYVVVNDIASQTWEITKIQINVSEFPGWSDKVQFTYEERLDAKVEFDFGTYNVYMNVVALSGFEYAEGTYEYVAIIEALLKEEYAVNYELVDGNGTIAKFESSLIWSVERPTIVDDSFTASIESDDIREYYNPNMSYTLTVVVDPTREGYTFEWYKDSLPISYDTQSIVVSTVNDSGIYYCDVSYNGKVVETNSVSVEILVNEIDVTRTRLENATLSYTGETQTVSVIVPNDIANLVTYTVSGNTGKEPGDYIATVVFTLKDSENYAFLNSRGRVELSWKIQSGSIDPTEKDPVFNFVYDVNGVYVKVDSTNGIKDADIAVNNVTSQYANFENEYGNIVFVYDITFVDVNNQKVVLGQDTFKVTLGLSGSYVGNDQLVIIYIADDNSVEKLESTVNGQYIEFTTTHFSKYAVVEPKSVTPPPSGSDSSTPDSSTDDSSTPDSSTEDSSTPDVSTEESSTPNISTDDSSSSEDVSTGPTSSDPSSSGEPGGSEPQPQTNDLWIWVLIGLALIIIALLLVLILRKKEPVVVPVAIAEATEEVSYIVVKENNVQVLALEEVQANDIVVAMPCKSHAIGSVTEGKVSIFKAPLPTNEIAEAGSYIVVNENNVDVVKVDENTILPEQPHVIGTVTEDKVSIFKEALPMKKVLGKVNEGSVVVYKQPKEALANNKPEQKVEEVVAQPAESNETVQVEVGQIEEGNDKIVIKIFKDPKVK